MAMRQVSDSTKRSDDRVGGRTSLPARLADMVHHRFLVWLALAYLAGMFFPDAGEAIRRLPLGEVPYLGLPVTMPALLLALLLFNAGFGIDAGQVRGLLRRPSTLLVPLAFSWLLPLSLVLLLAFMWPVSPARDACLVGLTLVAVMPVANSSCAWTQNAGGNLGLGLGLVLASTLLSPATTPLGVDLLVRSVLVDASAEGLREVGRGPGVMFLTVWVTAPVLAGIGVRKLLRLGAQQRALPALKLVNAVILLLLNYSNASLALPRVLEQGVDRAVFTVAAMTLIFGMGLFVGAWWIGQALRIDRGQRLALLFGLGMKNSGAALVLAGLFLEAMPAAMLPVIFCTLWQHLLAGWVDLRLSKEPLPSSQ